MGKTGLGDLVQSLASDKQTKLVNESEIKTDKPRGKSADPEYSKLSVYIPRELHKRLKIVAVAEDIEISAATQEALEQWLESLDS